MKKMIFSPFLWFQLGFVYHIYACGYFTYAYGGNRSGYDGSLMENGMAYKIRGMLKPYQNSLTQMLNFPVKRGGNFQITHGYCFLKSLLKTQTVPHKHPFYISV